MRKIARTSLIAAAVLAALIYLNNSSLLTEAPQGEPVLLAHRGMAQTFHREGLTNATCTATRIYPPAHDHLENTLASMQAAFAAGADVVEFDIHPTTDGHFAVFHDWTVDCRTEGKGVTREHTLAELKALDIGYGYTADGGATYPFRGKGVGLMPTLDEVLSRFPDKRFLINFKSNDSAEGEMLARHLARLPPKRHELLMAYGAERPIAALKQRLPAIKTMTMTSLKACGYRYLAVGWTGYVPQACHDTLLLIPINFAPFVWGWPNRFVERLRRAGTDVFTVGPYARGDAGSSGIDDEAAFADLPEHFDGGIWTNRIERIAPLVRNAAD
jgi:glycerophosphoryl diester phosphodiesterase